MIDHDPWGLAAGLPWLMGALVAYYLLRTCAALLLLACSGVRPGLRPAALRCAPAALRPALRRAIAGGLIGVALTGGSALASPNECPVPADGVPVLDRGTACTLGASAPSPGTRPPPAEVPQPAAPEVHVVRSGDSLWAITAAQLGPSATSEAIAEAWPRLWQANRAVVGDDPGLIRPGTSLSIPAQLQNGDVR